MDDDDVIDALNRLIVICRDGEALYRSAAEKLADLRSQALFMHLANQRSLGAAAFADLISAQGGEPVRRGMLAGETCRLYAAIESVVALEDRAALVERLRQTEERALDEFAGTLAKALPMDVRAVVDGQYQLIRQAHGRLSKLPGALTRQLADDPPSPGGEQVAEI